MRKTELHSNWNEGMRVPVLLRRKPPESPGLDEPRAIMSDFHAASRATAKRLKDNEATPLKSNSGCGGRLRHVIRSTHTAFTLVTSRTQKRR